MENAVAAAMLCMDDCSALGDSEIIDAIGEIANMIMGGVKTRVQHEVTNIEISIPSVVHGRQLRNRLGEGTVLRVVHLPGHTPGSVGFFLEEDGVLVAGDSLPGAGTPGGCLPLVLDLRAYRKSLERLLELPIATLHATHPFRGLRLPPTTVREGSEVESYLRESLEFADILSDALERQAGALKAGTPLGQVANDLVDSLPPDLGFKRPADLPVPGMALGTIFWNLPELRA